LLYCEAVRLSPPVRFVQENDGWRVQGMLRLKGIDLGQKNQREVRPLRRYPNS
jgi:hypothetical protein